VSVLELGQPYPLGVNLEEGGVNIAVFSAHAQHVELCVFDAQGQRESARHALFGPADDIWQGRCSVWL